MSQINNESTVKNQYATAGNLKTRISIHEKYSINKMGFGNWIFSNYCIEHGMKVLELGCGTGEMWKGHNDIISKCDKLVLSDLSEGMIHETKKNVVGNHNVEFKVVDIQNIPYNEDSFDIVIANMMLYHVPDLQRGLSEVRRVLKTGGKFYAATYGEHGIIEYISGLLSAYGVRDNVNKNFTLQNGKDHLAAVFNNIDMLEYTDSLHVTDVDDMVEYIYSLSSMTTLNSIPMETVRSILLQNMVDGILIVPKEYGMFIAY